MDIQVEQNRELEARLEQALSRWKLEKEAGAAETEKYIKMRSTSATLVEQLTHATTEVRATESVCMDTVVVRFCNRPHLPTSRVSDALLSSPGRSSN